MTSLLNRLFGRTKRGSGATAKNRLHFVLQHDRINLPPERAEEMKKEILAVIVKYLAVDQDRVEIALEQRDRLHSKLVAELPIVNETYTAESAKTQSPTLSTSAHSNGAGKVGNTEPDDGETAAEPESASEDGDKKEESKQPVMDRDKGDAPEKKEGKS